MGTNSTSESDSVSHSPSILLAVVQADSLSAFFHSLPVPRRKGAGAGATDLKASNALRRDALIACRSVFFSRTKPSYYRSINEGIELQILECAFTVNAWGLCITIYTISLKSISWTHYIASTILIVVSPTPRVKYIAQGHI